MISGGAIIARRFPKLGGIFSRFYTVIPKSPHQPSLTKDPHQEPANSIHALYNKEPDTDHRLDEHQWVSHRSLSGDHQQQKTAVGDVFNPSVNTVFDE